MAKDKKKLTGDELLKSARQTQADAQHIRKKAAERRKKAKGLDFSQNAFRIVKEATESK